MLISNRIKIKITAILIIFEAIGLLAQNGIAPQDESFDPAVLKEPPLPIMDNTLIYEIATDLQPPTVKPQNTPSDSAIYVEKMGWKIQVFSTSDYFLADSVYQKAQRKFENIAVEKVFNLPYYKIRVGNCVTREEAERLLSRALELNFPDAWVVRTQIRINAKTDIY